MNVFLITLQAVAALLGIGLLGFYVIGRRHVPSVALGVLTSIAIDVALPCLVLANILLQFTPQKYPDWWLFPLWWLGFTIVALILTLLTSLISKKETRGEFAMGLFFQNGIFFPLIIIAGLYGSVSSYLVVLFLFIFIQPSLVYGTYPFFIRKPGTVQKTNLIRILNPVLIMTLAGLAIVFGGIQAYVPQFLAMILTMIGGMATPLFMLILGGNVYNDFMNKETGGNKLEIGEALKFVMVKNFIFPLVFLALLVWLRPENPIAFLLLLQAAIPPITAIPVFTERMGGNRAISNQFIVASFVLSIISIPLMLLLFSQFFEMPV
jgi:predicted permease